MLNFSSWCDLPLIWGGIIALAIFMYVILDGFDLGCGIIFPFAPSDQCRDCMMNSIAPFWDGNETWLVLGGAGLFVAFPLAYAVFFPAVYLPIIFMLVGLIFRGIAFEFRFKALIRGRKLWDLTFHAGSILASFMQGIILGNFIQGIPVENRQYAGGSLDWVNGFSLFTGLALIFGYALLGATWLIIKTEGKTQKWAKKIARYVIWYVCIAMGLVSITMPFIDERIYHIWFDFPQFFYLLPIPFITGLCIMLLIRDLYFTKNEKRPFLLSLGLFLLGYIGLGISLYPWVIPFQLTLWQAAAAPESQSMMLVGTIFLLPLILIYTGYCYYVFRGKATPEKLY